MNKKILKGGFKYLIITIILLRITIIPMVVVDKEMQSTNIEEQEDVPLQEAVEENKIIANTKTIKNTKKTVKKSQKKKKTTKKVTTKKYVKAKVRRTNTNTYQNYAHDLVINKYGWSEYDFECLIKLWNRESGWNPNAHNKKSGAHGIPQSLPANKMASEGTDYYTNGYTQIKWGLKYIKSRYGSPAKAWQHSQRKGWY